MNINQKINVKGNRSAFPPHFTKDRAARERHAESIANHRAIPMKIMKRDYSSAMDDFDSQRLYFQQDRKTNYQEPKEPDYNAPTWQERSEEMARIQRELK